MNEPTTPVYVLTVTRDDGFALSRPSTSRSTIAAIFVHCLGHVEPKGELPWKLSLEQGNWTDAEITSAIAAFTSQVEPLLHDDLDCDATSMINDLQVFLAGEANKDE